MRFCRYGCGIIWNTIGVFQKDPFENLDKSNTRGYLNMLIGVFVFQSQSFPLYELGIRPRREIFSKQLQPIIPSQKKEMELMKRLWTE